MNLPDQLKTPAPAGRPGYDALDDFLSDAAAWDPAVEEVWLGVGDQEPGARDRELVAAARRLLDERRLTEPGMVYRLVTLLAETGALGAGVLAALAARALAAPAAGPDEGQPSPAGPRPETSLPPTGREREYDRGRDMAAQRPDGVGIVCVTGPAGVGKTHLAREIAAAAGPAARLEVSLSTPAPWMADGLEAKAPYDALRELLTQLGVHPAEVPDSMAGRRARYAAELAGLRPVVLIDGALDASQVLPLLPPRQGSVMITSRPVLTGLAGWNARQLPLRPMAEAESRRLALEVFSALGIEPSDRALTVVSERGDGLPGRIILLCRRMAGEDTSADAIPRLLDEDQQAVIRGLGLLPLSGADITAVRLGTGLSEDRAQAALDRLARLGLVTADVSGRVWVMTPMAVSGAGHLSVGQLREADYERVLGLYQMRTADLRDVLTVSQPESLSSLRSWAGDRWQAERAGVRALLSAAAGSGHPALARPLAAALTGVAAQVEGLGSGRREAEETVASVLRIASDADDEELAGWAVAWLEREVEVRGMTGPDPAALAVDRPLPPEPRSRLGRVVAPQVTPRTGPVIFGTAGQEG
ncbi:MAG TPA: AAA family ATPase [Streptosporangiaceae bacterium]|nr:AAA family ATPase [Streptosporangiaceae bacterium]